MSGICDTCLVDKRIILFLEKGDNLETISRKINIPLGRLKVIIIDLVERNIKISEKVDLILNTLAEQFKEEIKTLAEKGYSIRDISAKSGISMYFTRKIMTRLLDIHIETNHSVKLKTFFLAKRSKSQIIKGLAEGLNKKEISNRLGISIYYLDKIISGRTRKSKKVTSRLKIMTKTIGMQIVRRIREGVSLGEIAQENEITIPYIHKILSKLKKKNIIETTDIVKLKGLTFAKTSRLLEVKRLYDELGTLESVAKKINITRERVRQLLQKGVKNKLFTYKPHTDAEDLSKEISKEQIVKELVLYGNYNNLRANYGLSNSAIYKLLEFYLIDAVYIKRLRRHKRDLMQYQSIVDFLGHHPTTTELSKKKEWRALWHRIYHRWGCIDNFRKEYGIPIPKKGYSEFREKTIPKGIEALKAFSQRKRKEIKNNILNLLREQKEDKLNTTVIAVLIDKNRETTKRCLLELLNENKVRQEQIGKAICYFIKETD
ncbi:MAG: hypothetical protein KKC39_01010 [Candidatus Omnitrophica bacterium]|nr:hypothetical protein [Candidatus Omnitrophota bacterium]MCG2707428.1 hypothetical protein [Candidatus Omnitrophota bacterium]